MLLVVFLFLIEKNPMPSRPGPRDGTGEALAVLQRRLEAPTGPGRSVLRGDNREERKKGVFNEKEKKT